MKANVISGLQFIPPQRRKKVLIAYTLLAVDNAAAVAIPSLLGLAVDGILANKLVPLSVLVSFWISSAALSVFRQRYDMRVFSTLASEAATFSAVSRLSSSDNISLVASHSALSREAVSFVAQELPAAVQSGIFLIGALSLLATYDRMTAIVGLAVLFPAAMICKWGYRVSYRSLYRLHTRSEQEVNILASRHAIAIRKYFLANTRRRIQLADAQAAVWGVLRLCSLGVIIYAILRIAHIRPPAGDGVAIVTYVIMLASSLSELPSFVTGLARTVEIRRRMSR